MVGYLTINMKKTLCKLRRNEKSKERNNDKKR
jgi:hypothetical protein